ncbi:hypothetical protein ACROYT_G033311 [Oculina patagonica]
MDELEGYLIKMQTLDDTITDFTPSVADKSNSKTTKRRNGGGGGGRGDEEVKSALSEYGELKSEVVRLKYKADHELAGMKNGNRLVKMILDKPSIPYSLRIGAEWQLGNMSYNCDQREEENNEAPHGQTVENDVQAADADHDQQEAPGSGDVVTGEMRPNKDLEVSKKEMD